MDETGVDIKITFWNDAVDKFSFVKKGEVQPCGKQPHDLCQLQEVEFVLCVVCVCVCGWVVYFFQNVYKLSGIVSENVHNILLNIDCTSCVSIFRRTFMFILRNIVFVKNGVCID